MTLFVSVEDGTLEESLNETSRCATSFGGQSQTSLGVEEEPRGGQEWRPSSRIELKGSIATGVDNGVAVSVESTGCVSMKLGIKGGVCDAGIKTHRAEQKGAMRFLL
mmetsp:Transcript_2082/g.2933  ORF Transcript_2082/g.2933 Transcript_2082/m.2933 type:complete len:107 (-) Transcript_2082:56-376(-)|eukprot:CAMPEP_0196589158 /NCGR_PEP_ID=MMETSP1081-20130531/62850_1 /TAXON_ID=36882 /ORGANISM="Pyramimonas amylifera, Strain CCMP720" /LENGTH=106 /DNA_ID=CAMNT_0041911881 /DNA_START=121 /DNA_END=441 /DNA_ORIENTATION=+